MTGASLSLVAEQHLVLCASLPLATPSLRHIGLTPHVDLCGQSHSVIGRKWLWVTLG